MNTIPTSITSLKDNEVFVFGSNMNGYHAGGAAAQAKDDFEAQEGIGEGLTGKCYAFPTLNFQMQRRSMTVLAQSRDKLYATAKALPDKTFLLTRVGCGIAGYSEKRMAELFKDSPKNIVKPTGW